MFSGTKNLGAEAIPARDRKNSQVGSPARNYPKVGTFLVLALLFVLTCSWLGVVRDLEKGAVGTRRRPKLGNA
jgi:hypothetical protein